MTLRDLWFFVRLPVAAIADECREYVARIDTRYASALNPEEGTDD